MKKMSSIKMIALLFCAMVLQSYAATLTQIQNFGDNPTNLQMYIYKPSSVANVKNPPIVVVPHSCHGKAPDMAGSDWNSAADQYKFIVIYPGNFFSKDSCWDVQSTATLTHNGKGDSYGIVSMVKYVEKTYGGDSNRVYVVGYSSGGMMANVLLGTYPDVFKAGASFAGVAFGCFAGAVDSKGWNSTCANGNTIKTPAQWGDLVRAAYPSFKGTRPKMQLGHGTNDVTVNYKNFTEEIKQWTNVLGVSDTPTTTEPNKPKSTFTRTRYADKSGNVMVEAISEKDLTHYPLDYSAGLSISWFGLDQVVAVDNRKSNIVDNNGQHAEVKILHDGASNTLYFTVSSIPGRVEMSVYNLNGKQMHTFSEQLPSTGKRLFVWDGKLNTSEYCPAGVYVLSVKINGLVTGSYRFSLFAK